MLTAFNLMSLRALWQEPGTYVHILTFSNSRVGSRQSPWPIVIDILVDFVGTSTAVIRTLTSTHGA